MPIIWQAYEDPITAYQDGPISVPNSLATDIPEYSIPLKGANAARMIVVGSGVTGGVTGAIKLWGIYEIQTLDRTTGIVAPLYVPNLLATLAGVTLGSATVTNKLATPEEVFFAYPIGAVAESVTVNALDSAFHPRVTTAADPTLVGMDSTSTVKVDEVLFGNIGMYQYLAWSFTALQAVPTVTSINFLFSLGSG
jgi:hypothetical protein